MENNTTLPQKNQAIPKKNNKDNFVLQLHSAGEILSADFPEPVYVIPDILPIGLSILAGAPKVGKSWLGLQMAKATSSGSEILGMKVAQGPVLYLALEDPMRRLKNRMKNQSWSLDLPVDFIVIGEFKEKIGDIRNGGGKRLAQIIKEKRYRLTVVDTLSRAISGDQNDSAVMTSWLAPLQEIAHAHNSAILVIDHHNKGFGSGQDMISDILGSTAKGAMADTILGLYRERNKAGARLSITGREVEERDLELRIDWKKGLWQLNSDGNALPTTQADLLTQLEKIGPATTKDLEAALGRNRGSIYKELTALEKNGHVEQVNNKKWVLVKK